METAKTSGININILSDQNEENSIAMEKRSGFLGATAKNVLDPGPRWEDQPISAPRFSDTETAFIPDMFVSFASRKPKENPNYEGTRLESAAWMKE